MRKHLLPILLLVFTTAAGCGRMVSAGRQKAGDEDATVEAQKLYQSGDLAGAEDKTRAALEANAANVPAHYLMGKIYRDTGRPLDAIQEWEGVVNLDPEHVRAYVDLARAYQEQKLFEQALAAALEAVRIQPGEGRLYNLLGTVYLDKGQYDQAVGSYEKALELKPDSAWVYNNLGLAYLEGKMPEKAEAQLRKAVEADPKLAVAHNNLGAALLQMRKLDEALAEFKKASELDPASQKAAQNVSDVEELIKRKQRKSTRR
jgi:tetratricopeptide (TPR) repeat protein